MKKIMIFTIIILAFIACDDKPEEEKEIPLGHIEEINTGKQIPIYKGAGVSDSAAAAATTSRIAGYNSASATYKMSLIGKINKIVIVSGGEVNHVKSDMLLNIGVDCTYSWNDILTLIRMDWGISQIRDSARDAVRMVNGNAKSGGKT